MNLISETEAKGINTFVGTFSLPSLIFMSLAQLDLSSVNWLFLLSVLLSKSIVFFSVIVVTLLVGRPVNYGRAGIFAIFCTQSNDFAVGYPIGKRTSGVIACYVTNVACFSGRFIQKHTSRICIVFVFNGAYKSGDFESAQFCFNGNRKKT